MLARIPTGRLLICSREIFYYNGIISQASGPALRHMYEVFITICVVRDYLPSTLNICQLFSFNVPMAPRFPKVPMISETKCLAIHDPSHPDRISQTHRHCVAPRNGNTLYSLPRALQWEPMRWHPPSRGSDCAAPIFLPEVSQALHYQ